MSRHIPVPPAIMVEGRRDDGTREMVPFTLAAFVLFLLDHGAAKHLPTRRICALAASVERVVEGGYWVVDDQREHEVICALAENAGSLGLLPSLIRPSLAFVDALAGAGTVDPRVVAELPAAPAAASAP